MWVSIKNQKEWGKKELLYSNSITMCNLFLSNIKRSKKKERLHSNSITMCNLLTILSTGIPYCRKIIRNNRPISFQRYHHPQKIPNLGPKRTTAFNISNRKETLSPANCLSTESLKTESESGFNSLSTLLQCIILRIMAGISY